MTLTDIRSREDVAASEEAPAGHDIADDYDISDIVREFWNARRLIGACTIAAMVIAAVATSFVPKTYEATATVQVAPPAFSDSPRTASLSVESDARLAETVLIRDLVRRDLQTKGVLSADEEPRPIKTVLYPSTDSKNPYLPLIGLTASWTTREGAQAIANAWARHFVTEQAQLASSLAEASAGFDVTEYPNARQALTDAERSLEALKGQHAAQLAAARIADGVDPPESDGAQGRAGSGALESTRLGPKYAAVIAEEHKVEELTRELATVRQAADATSVSALEVALKGQQATAARVRADLIASEQHIEGLIQAHAAEEAVIQRRLDEARARFLVLQAKMAESPLPGQQANLRLAAEAVLPISPTRPDMKLNIGAAGIAGFMVSLIGASMAPRFRKAAASDRAKSR